MAEIDVDRTAGVKPSSVRSDPVVLVMTAIRLVDCFLDLVNAVIALGVRATSRPVGVVGAPEKEPPHCPFETAGCFNPDQILC